MENRQVSATSPKGQRDSLHGWGGTSPSVGTLLSPTTPDEVANALKSAGPRGVVARGLGRSYGDAAQNGGGEVLRLPSQMQLGQDGILTADAGASLDDMMRLGLPRGWFVPVTPGTRYVTLGGAIAADIHGKNHHVAGTFSQHVESIDLLIPDGTVRVLTQNDPLFWATAGGMGLTGIILSARVRMYPVETSWMRVDTERANDLDDLMAKLTSRDEDFRYSVAWFDCAAKGSKLGRAVITRGDHARLSDLPESKRTKAQAFAPKTLLKAPPYVPNGLLNPFTVGLFNEFWYRKAPVLKEGQLQRISTFFHPLDGVEGWNRIYGSQGFLQYQFVVPFGAEETMRSIVEHLSALGVPSFLAVLKRFGAGNSGLLSFPSAGWTLALDIPTAVPGLAALLDRLDDEVVSVGGRIYLAKDSRLRPSLLGEMYPRLAEFRAIRAELDPDRIIQSDLARRLGL